MPLGRQLCTARDRSELSSLVRESYERQGTSKPRTLCECLFLADFVAEIGLPTARNGWCIFKAIRCHPLDCAGDLRSTLLTLATLTQRTKGRTVVAGRPTWQACGGFAQSLPT